MRINEKIIILGLIDRSSWYILMSLIISLFFISHRVKRSSGESMEDSFNTDNENDQNTHVRIARDASPSRQLSRRVRSNTAFSAWGGK